MASAGSQRRMAQFMNIQNDQNKATTLHQLYTGVGGAQGIIQNNVDQGRNLYGDYLGRQLSSLGGAYDRGRADLASGYNDAAGSIRTGIAGLDPFASRGNAAGDMYANSLGLNGAAGNAAATSAFQAGPGYQWQVDQATDAAARKANALGISASGNTLTELTKLGSNLANQAYGGWQDRLSGLNTAGQSAATTQAGLYGNLGALQAQQGQGLASLGQTYGQNQSAAYQNAANTLNTNLQNASQLNAGLYQGLNNNNVALSNAVMGQNNNNAMGAAAASDAARNANSNLGLGLAGQVLGMGLGGGQTIGGSLFSGLGSLFR